MGKNCSSCHCSTRARSLWITTVFFLSLFIFFSNYTLINLKWWPIKTHLLRNDKIQRQWAKLKKVPKRGGFQKLRAKRSLWSSNFLNYKLSIPKKLWNSFMVSNFVFFIFWSLVWERRKKWLDSDGKEKKSWLRPIQGMKKSDFVVNEFLLIGRVYPMCCFHLNLPKMVDSSL